jgi:hypothetical protein
MRVYQPEVNPNRFSVSKKILDLFEHNSDYLHRETTLQSSNYRETRQIKQGPGIAEPFNTQATFNEHFSPSYFGRG